MVKHRKTRRERCARNARKIYGGAYNTAAWGFDGPLVPGAGLDSATRPIIADCGAGLRPTVNVAAGGIPGLSGGGKRRKYHGGTQLVGPQVYPEQAGGRYGFTGVDVSGPNPVALNPSIPCEASVKNSLNPGPVTATTLPNQAQMGGATITGSPYLNVPNAGYAVTPNPADAGINPFARVIGYPASTSNPACSHTGGSRRKSKRSSTKRRRNNKKRSSTRRRAH